MEAVLTGLSNYLIDDALVLVPVLLIVGQMLKTIPKCPDWCIPWVLTAVSITLSVFMLEFTVNAVVQGILVAGAAVYGNQLWKQTTKGIANSEGE